MSGASWYSLNQRVNSLQAQINNIIPVPPVPVTAVLLAGNQTLTTGVKTFTNLPECVALPTTNGQLVNKLYVDNFGMPNLQQVCDDSNILSNFIAPSTASITSTNFTNNRQLLLNANADPTIKMIDNLNSAHFTTFDIDTLNLNGVSTNWSAIVAGSVTPTITQVLTAGNNGLDVSQIFSATASTITTNIDNAEVQIINSSGGIYSLLEYDKLTIDDGAGEVHLVDSGGEVITGANASGGTITNTITKSSLNIADIAPAPAWSYQSNIELVQPFGGQVRFTGLYNPSGYTLDTTYNSNGITQSFPIVPPTISNYTITTQGDLDIISPNVDITATTLTFNGIPVLTSAPNIEQVLLAGNNANSNSIFGINDIQLTTINGGAYPPPSAGLSTVLSVGNTTGTYNIDFQNLGSIDNVVNINGLPYPPVPVAPYGLTGVLTISDNAGALNITNVNDIGLTSINGSAYPPTYSTPDLASVLSAGANAGIQSIDMNSQSINNCFNINTSQVNGVTYLPAKFSAVFPTSNLGSVGSGGQAFSGTSIGLPVGNYQITYTITFDSSLGQGGGGSNMVRGYCALQGGFAGIIYPYMVGTVGYYGSQLVSYDASTYPNYITATDFITIATADSYYHGAYQENTAGSSVNNVYISAVIQAV